MGSPDASTRLKMFFPLPVIHSFWASVKGDLAQKNKPSDKSKLKGQGTRFAAEPTRWRPQK